MSDYKVIFKDKHPMWQPGCPIMVTTIQVARNIETAQCYLQYKLRNVSEKGAGHISATANITSSSNETRSIPIDLLDADIAPNAERTPRAIALDVSDVSKATIVIDSIDEAKGWEKPNALPSLKRLKLSHKAQIERSERLKEAGVPDPTNLCSPIAGDGWWICNCGKVNVGTKTCIHCCSSLILLQSLEDEEQLEKWADEREESRKNSTYHTAVSLLEDGSLISLPKAIELFDSLGDYEDSSAKADEAKVKLEATKNAAKSKGKRIGTIAGIVIVALIAIVLLITQFIIPETKYQNAMNRMQSEDYGTAAYLFEELGGYKDSGNKAAEAQEAYENQQLEEAQKYGKELLSGSSFVIRNVQRTSDKVTFDLIYDIKDGEKCEAVFKQPSSNQVVALSGKGTYHYSGYIDQSTKISVYIKNNEAELLLQTV